MMSASREPLDPLSRLAIRHGSDKFGGHLYTPFYHALLAPWRERPLRFLEIGVGGYDMRDAGGSSLRMWADYFPEATIVGLDFHEKAFERPARVILEQGSQDDPAVLERLHQRHGPFDVVVDDGSHLPAHIVASFQNLYPRIAADGIYIVEDVQLSFRPETGGENGGAGTIFALAHAIGLAMHEVEGHRPSDARIAALGRATMSITTARNVIAFRRGSNTYPSNLAFDLRSPEVTTVFDRITREAEDNPSPRDSLSRIDMAIWGGRRDVAAVLALASAARWPHDRALLVELERMMLWASEKNALEHIRALRANLEASKP